MGGFLTSVTEGGTFQLSLADGGTLPCQSQPGLPGTGTVTNVTGSAPIVITGAPATTPNVTITPATDAAAGSMSAADKTKLDGLSSSEVQSVTVTAPITLAGTAANPVVGFAGTDINASGQVDAISGPSPIPVTPAVLQWTQGTVGPTLSQAQQANGAAPQTMNIAPQAPGAGATNATNGTPASALVTLAAPVNGGAESFLQVQRAGGQSTYIGGFPAVPLTIGCIWNLPLGTPPSNSNFAIAFTSSAINFNAPTSGGASNFNFEVLSASATDGMFLGQSTAGNGSGVNLTGRDSTFGGGRAVAKVAPASVEPTTNAAAGTLFWSFTDGALKCRSANGWRANLVAIGSGALNTQKPFVDTFSSPVRTVSTATPAAFTGYTTLSDTIGWINVRLKSKAATSGVGIAVGDGAFAEYRLGYKNVAGTVTLATAGITLLGSVQTTAAALTSTLTAAAVGATVVFSVTNVNLATIDSLIDCTIDVC